MHGHLNVKFVSILALGGGERSTSRAGRLSPDTPDGFGEKKL